MSISEYRDEKYYKAYEDEACKEKRRITEKVWKGLI